MPDLALVALLAAVLVPFLLVGAFARLVPPLLALMALELIVDTLDFSLHI